MNKKMYYRVSATAFAVIAVLHGARSLYGWEASVSGVDIPLWVSYCAMAIAAYLAYRGFSVKVK